MKRLKEKLPFIFLVMFMFAISLFTYSIFNVTSFATSISDISENQIQASFTFNGSTQTTSPSFTTNYTATDYNLTVTVTNATAYKWYFATGDDYSELAGQTTNTIKIRNCNQSGNYVCAVTTTEGVKVTEPVSVTINPKVIKFTSFTAENKEYDGTTKVNIIAELDPANDIIDSEKDDVTVTVVGNTSSPNADKKKYVTVRTSDVTFSSSNGSNYIASEDLPTDIILVDINKKPVTFIWETVDNKSAYDYNGLDQIANISVYYYGLQNAKTQLAFTISGYNGSNNFYNEFKNAGNYTATATLTSREVNFEITNLTKRLDIKKVTPVVTIDNSPFIYNGLEQDAKDRVTVNNSEQTLNFINNKFTSVLDGNDREVTVYADESMNYMGFTRKFKITVDKATASIDISGVKKDFTYNGARQVINTGAVINNGEQVLNYSNNYFTTVLEGNNKEVSVFANATDNYNYVSSSFTISVKKATIDKSSWRWNYVNPYVYSVGTERVLRVDYYPENIVRAVYTNERATNVGVYEATVTFSLIDSANYNEVGSFPSIIWRINKQTVTIPVLNNVTTTYNGSSQTLSNLSSNLLYTVKGNEQTNAGNYPVTISLKEPNNFEWDNGNSNDLVINWTIKKANVDKPNFNLDAFDGTPESIGITEDDVYELIYSDDRFMLLGLKDGDNYTWEGTTRPYLRIDLGGGFFDGPALPIFVITLTIITLVLIAVYFAVHSTIILRRHHKKVALIKARKLKKQLTLVPSNNLPEDTDFTIKEMIPAIFIQEKKQELEKEETPTITKNEKVEEPTIAKNEKVEEPTKPEEVVEETKTPKPRAKRKSAKRETGEKTRKPYVKSRKIENKKKVAQKKKEINAKKVLAQKEAEKKKIAAKKAKQASKKTTSKSKPKTATSSAKSKATKTSTAKTKTSKATTNTGKSTTKTTK